MKIAILTLCLFSINSHAFFGKIGKWVKLEPQVQLYESTQVIEASREDYFTKWSQKNYAWDQRFKLSGQANYSHDEFSYPMNNQIFDVYKGSLKVGAFQTTNTGNFQYTDKLDNGTYSLKMNSKKFACAHDFVVTSKGQGLSNNLQLNCFSYNVKVFDTRSKNRPKRLGRGIASAKE
jgi:hypothetical protein